MNSKTFEKILSRFLDDQEVSEDHPYFGQFGRSRKPEERMFYQKDGEPLLDKPQFFMTFNAVQSLIYLREIARRPREFKSSTVKDIIKVVKKYSDRIKRSVSLAGDLAERLLVKNNGNIIMQNKLYHPGSFVSHRHTIGASLVLLLLDRQPRMVENIINRLLNEEIQNKDGGWPIANRIYMSSDLLCSSHAAFLFHLALQREQFSNLASSIRSKLETTLAYLVIENHKNGGLWIYEKEMDKVPFTARTYPELSGILREYHLGLVCAIPQSLLEYYPLDPKVNFIGIQNLAQLEIRMAYVFRLVSDLQPSPFLELYLQSRSEVVKNYSKDLYYSTYELCCLIIMMLDRVELSAGEKASMVLGVAEPLIKVIPFVGKTYSITKDIYVKLKKKELL